MVIGEGRAEVELERGILLKEVHRLGARLKKRLDTGGIELSARFMSQIGARLGRAVVDPRPQRRAIARDPHPATGTRRGAAEDRFFLDDKNV